MPNGYTMAHCEWLARYAYGVDTVSQPDQFHVLLYDDAEDQIEFGDDIGDVTTEPSSGNYGRATLAFPADIRGTLSEDGYVDLRAMGASFDFEGVTGEVDYAGIVWEAELQDDDEPVEHLMVRSELDRRWDLETVKSEYEVDVGWQLHTLF